MRILVAEDNTANRDLMVELLKNRGHSAVGVNDGLEALAALDREEFEIIFMDEEMPGMTGIEATRAIRERNALRGRRPVIIGLSGNAEETDERRCLEAGMDAFLAKPAGVLEIAQVLEWFGRPSPQPAQTETPSPRAESRSESHGELGENNLAAHLRRATGGDGKLARSLVKTFLADAPKKLSALRRALARKDAERVAVIAHSLKGSIEIFGAPKATAAARSLQALGRSGNLDGAAGEFQTLESEFNDLRSELLALQAAATPARKARTQRSAASRACRKR